MKPSKNAVISRHFACFVFQPYVFFLLFLPLRAETREIYSSEYKTAFRRVIRSRRLRAKYTHCTNLHFLQWYFTLTHGAPPERESVRNRLRQLQEQGRQQKPRKKSLSFCILSSNYSIIISLIEIFFIFSEYTNIRIS